MALIGGAACRRATSDTGRAARESVRTDILRTGAHLLQMTGQEADGAQNLKGFVGSGAVRRGVTRAGEDMLEQSRLFREHLGDLSPSAQVRNGA